ASVLDDSRTVFRTRRGDAYIPADYDHQFHGPVPLRVALASSLNVPAVAVESQLGLGRVLDLADELDLQLGDPERYDLSLTLGGPGGYAAQRVYEASGSGAGGAVRPVRVTGRCFL